MELHNTDQLHEAKTRLSASMRKLEEAVNGRISRVKERVSNQAQQFSQEQEVETRQLVRALKDEIAALGVQQKVLQEQAADRESVYNKLKSASEQSVDVLDIAIARLEAYNSGE